MKMKALVMKASRSVVRTRRQLFSSTINDEFDESDDLEALKTVTKSPDANKEMSPSPQEKEPVDNKKKRGKEAKVSSEKLRVMGNISEFVWEDYAFVWKPLSADKTVASIQQFVDKHGELPQAQGSRENESVLGAEVEKQKLAYRLVKDNDYSKLVTHLQKERMWVDKPLLPEPGYEQMASALLEPMPDRRDDLDFE